MALQGSASGREIMKTLSHAYGCGVFAMPAPQSPGLHWSSFAVQRSWACVRASTRGTPTSARKSAKKKGRGKHPESRLTSG